MSAMHNYHLYAGRHGLILDFEPNQSTGERRMSSLLKSTLCGLGLLAGVAATAHAQSVSALPPTGPATAPTATAPTYSSAKIYPNPGGSVNWQEEHSQPIASGKISPEPGGSANWQHQPYAASSTDQDPARQPYSTSGFGPKPN
jgi:hypothetical protein